MRNRTIALTFLSAVSAIGLMLVAAKATELQVLEGVPTVEQIEAALAPTQAPSGVQFRGITLGKPVAAAGATTVAAAPVQARAAISLNIMFDFNSDKVTTQGRQVLDNLGRALNSERLRVNRFLLEGHTDSVGSVPYNQVLSERRANSAKAYLVQNFGIDPKRLATAGKGKSEPLDPADPARDINRRVQIMNLGS